MRIAELRALAERVVRAGISAADARRAVRRHLGVTGGVSIFRQGFR
ncbi:MAG TPA: hypothetical protein PKA64_16740 [Myxococcota bacterium]|nr:hypothetical protein [Myxococcota bacterium]